MPSPFERDLGRAIRSHFGEETKVVRFGDDVEVDDCFIVSGLNWPIKGVTSYGSVGLSRATQRSGTASVKVEILAACASSTPHIDNLVASCVFDSAKNGTNVVYGTLIPNVVDQYEISHTLQHVTFVSPFLWKGMSSIKINEENIHFLLMLPISNSERIYLENNGIDGLEAIFDEVNIDVYDINRPSALR